MSDDLKAVQVRISGRVQGVSFRYWTQQEARRAGLTGWVRNEADGSVLAMIAGPEEAVSAMIERLWNGPATAAVTDVTVESLTLSEIPAGFRITG
jgi:acylphosphatase